MSSNTTGQFALTPRADKRYVLHTLAGGILANGKERRTSAHALTAIMASAGKVLDRPALPGFYKVLMRGSGLSRGGLSLSLACNPMALVGSGLRCLPRAHLRRELPDVAMVA